MGAGRDRGGDRATTGRPTGQTRYSVPVAADLLGITGEGVRSRIKRGTLPTDREAGAVFVVLEANRATDQVRQGVDQSTDRAAGQDPREKLVEELRDRITYLDVQLDARTEELREHRWLLAAALERIPPQLEAAEAPVSSGPGDTPLDRTGGQQAATEGREGGPEEGRRRSWWRESFGFGE